MVTSITQASPGELRLGTVTRDAGGVLAYRRLLVILYGNRVMRPPIGGEIGWGSPCA